MTLPTAEEITNLYLYGHETKPISLVDESLIRPTDIPNIEKTVDLDEYMNGPGRFANPAFFEIVKLFFSPTSSGLAPGRYDEFELRPLIGTNLATIELNQLFYEDETNDYAQRTYIWNTGTFEIADDLKDETGNVVSEGARFVIEENGDRYIENFAIIPTDYRSENFDFETGNYITGIANEILEPWIDPNGIGRTVELKFTGTRTMTTYTFADYQNDTASAVFADPSLPLTKTYSEISNLTQTLFDSGNTRFLDENNKPIIYGTDGSDSLLGTITATGVDLANHRFLGQYVANGIRYIGGLGADTIVGSDGQDYLEGGEGDDTYVVSDGDTILDTDDIGRVILDDQVLYGATKENGATNWVSDDEKVTYSLNNATLTVTSQNPSGNSTITIESFVSGDLGIWLTDAPTDPVFANTFTGDSWFEGTHNLQNFVTADLFLTASGYTADNDLVEVPVTWTGGFVSLYGFDGDDRIVATPGTDTLGGMNGNDTLVGGAGSDILYGGDGKDILYAETEADIDKLFDPAETATDATVDFLQGGADDDQLYGSAGNNFMDGGGGHDLIAAGAGDDFILGDALFTLIPDVSRAGEFQNPDGSWIENVGYDGWYATQFEWLVTQQNGEFVFSNQIIDSSVQAGFPDGLPVELQGNDVIYAGAGDDVVFASGGNDVVHAGTGIDFVDGGYGIDVITGGAGDDILFGELADTEISGLETNDVIFGDEGNDTLVGAYGSDNLHGGAGDDQLLGDADFVDGIDQGDDILDGFDGNDNLWGFGGNDRLNGGEGNDNLIGDFSVSSLAAEFHGDDFLEGGAGVDNLWGGGGNDILHGGSENDFLAGDATDVGGLYHGDDRLYGETGDDFLYGGGGNDFLSGGLGIDYLAGDDIDLEGSFHGSDSLFGGDGDDTLFGFGNDDTLLGGSGNDYLVGDDDSVNLAWHGNDVLYGEDGNDTVSGQGGNDQIFGGAGADNLLGGTGNDTLDGGADNDTLKGGAGDDTLNGGAGIDRLYGDGGNDTLQGGRTAGDLLVGGTGNDIYLFSIGDGDTTILDDGLGTGSYDVLRFIEGIVPENVSVARVGNSLQITIITSGEVITISNHFLGKEISSIEFSDGTSWGDATLKQMVLIATGGNDSIIGYESDDTLSGLGGNDFLDGREGDDTISGGDGNDTLYGREGNDVLDGGSGGDSINGGDGDDTLRGGTGNDSLRGDEGNDTYLYASGDGNTTIINLNFNDGNHDVLQFLEGVSPGDIQVSSSSNRRDLILTLQSTGEAITVTNHFSDNRYELDAIQFSDGTVWYPETIMQALNNATSGNDIFFGGIGDDHLLGLDGNDTISGGAGNDNLEGGSGADSLFGDAGDDRLEGGSGNDTLEGGAGQDSFDGGDGNDILNGGSESDILFGGSGDDILRGGTGFIDRLNGGDGNDTYLFGLGDGTTEINADGHDTLRFLDGITPADITFGRDLGFVSGAFSNPYLYNDLLITIRSTGEVITIRNFFTATTSTTRDLAAIEFADGTSWTRDDVQTYVTQGSENNDELFNYDTQFVLFGSPNTSNSVDTLNGFGGDDNLYGGVTDETLSGGTGNDYLYGSVGDDLLLGGDGIDRLFGEIGNDTLIGGDGRDFLYGGSGHDTLSGGTGINDSLQGQHGSDTYLFAAGDGDTSINNLKAGYTSNHRYKVDTDSRDVLRLLNGISPGDVSVSQSGNNLVLTITTSGVVGATSEVITVFNFFLSTDYTLHSVEFSDGTIWNTHALASLSAGGTADVGKIDGTIGVDSITGTDGDDIINGLDGNDYLSGADGNDILNGGDGTDELFGGIGNDTLRGGTGSNDLLRGWSGDDTYLFGLGDGDTTIDNYDTLRESHDVLRFLDGIAPGDVVATRSGDDLLLTVNVGGILGSETNPVEVITVTNFFSSFFYDLNAIEFADGTTWDTETIRSIVGATEENDILVANGGGDAINGLGGNDVIDGSSGNDTLTGGTGDDIIHGNNGDDVLNGGDGRDSLHGGNGDDILRGGASAGTGDWLIGGSGNDIYLFGIGDGNTTINNIDADVDRQDRLRFLAGIVPGDVELTRSGEDLLLTIQSSQEVITVLSFFGFATNDSGINIIEFADGTSWDSTDAIKLLVGGTDTNDVITGSVGDDTINGLAGHDILYGGAGNDILDGGDGNDLLYGGSGDDTLRGGTGWSGNVFSTQPQNDILIGEAGNDTYLFDIGDGNTTISNNDSGVGRNDVLRFLAGVVPSDVVVTRLNSSLLLTIQSTGEVITVTGFFSGSRFELNAVEFTDGTIWDLDTLRVMSNTAPVVSNEIVDQQTLEGWAFSFAIPANSFTDIDRHNTLSYSASLSDGSALPGWLSFDVATQTFSGTPAIGEEGILEVRVTASDGTDIVSDVFSLNVKNANNLAPTVSSPVPDQQATEDAAFSFTIPVNSFTDVDAGDTLSYSATLSDGGALPDWLSFDATTQTFSGIPGNDEVGTIDVKITAFDGIFSTSDVFSLNVINTNDAPVLTSAITDQQVDEDVAFSFTLPTNTFTDVDASDTLIYSATLSDDSTLPTWLSFDAATLTFSGTPGDAEVGAYDVKVTASDGAASVSDVFSLTVNNVNNAPIVSTAIADQQVAEDATFSFTVPFNTFFDADGDTLSYTATFLIEAGRESFFGPLPSWLSFDSVTQTFSGTPGSSEVGSYTVRVTASDGYASVSDNFILTVASGAVNTAPVVSTAIADQQVTEDATFSFTLPANSFTDADVGDTLTYSASLNDGTALPTWLNFDGVTQTFSGTPGNDDVSAIDVKVTASDGTASISDTFTLTIVNTNDAPVVSNLIADQQTAEDAVFNFTLPASTFADIDVGDTLSYSTSLEDNTALPTWLSFDAVTQTFSGTPGNDDVGALDVKVTADDGNGGIVADTFTLTVNNINDAPEVLNLIADQQTAEDAVFNFTVPASTFADIDAGDVLTYSASLDDGSALPAWLSFNALTQTFTGTPGNDEVGTLDVKVTASDGLANVSDTFALTINNTNDAPVVSNLIADQQTAEDAVFNFTVPASTFADIDAGDVLTYSASLSDGSLLPAWLSFDAVTQTFNGTPDNDEVGMIDVKVTASDGLVSVSDTFALTINNTNDAPIVFAAIADQQTAEDAAFNFTVPASTFADIDTGDVLTYSASLDDGTALPAWLSFNALTQTFTGTPGNDEVGTLDVKVTAFDGTASTSDTFTLTINNTNDAPEVSNLIADQQSIEGTLFSFTIPENTFVDIDAGDTLTYTATLSDGSILPGWLNFDAATQTFSGTPDIGTVGAFDIEVTASDGAASASDVFSLNVNDTNSSITLGSVNDDIINGSSSDDIIDGLNGNDQIFGVTGNDTLFGNTGNDSLSGGDGDDRLIGGDGADILNGGNGNDILVGGLGNDTLDGGIGRDIYQFNVGDGQDVISNFDPNQSSVDKLVFGNGITIDQLTLTKKGDHLIVQLDDGSDQITLSNWFISSDYELDSFEFADGGIYSADELLTALPVYSVVSDPTVAESLTGYAGVDIMSGGTGNDTLSGLDGNDTLIGGAGDDTLNGDSHDDVLIGELGDDTLNGQNGSDILTGGAGNDALNGGNGDDVLVGGSGNDLIDGNNGNDTILFGLGDGQDVVSNYDTDKKGTDKLVFGEGITLYDIWLSQSGNDLQINLSGTDDQIIVSNWFISSDYELDAIETGSFVLLNNQVDQLVSAMASYSVPSGEGNVIPQDVRDALEPILVDSWQAA